MANLQSSGAISIGDIKNLFGGPGNPSLSNYYRGGSYIPATKTISSTTRQPASGEYYNRGSYGYQLAEGWHRWVSSGSPTQNFCQSAYYVYVFQNVAGEFNSYSTGGWTYFKGSYRASGYYNDGYSTPSTIYFHGYYREQYSSTTVSINTGIPSSGQISLSQFYGAEKP